MLEFQAGNHQKLLIVTVVIICVGIAFCISVAPCAKSFGGIVPLQCSEKSCSCEKEKKNGVYGLAAGVAMQLVHWWRGGR